MSTISLDDVLNATTGPTILSQNHNLNSINWVGGVTDPGEMIGCGRYQELRRLAGEGDGEYQDRLNRLLPTLPAAHREQIEKAMKAAAIRRAGLDATGGKIALVVAGDPAWHALGTNVATAMTFEEAAALSVTNWKVKKVQDKYQNPVTGEWELDPDGWSICRMDTGVRVGKGGPKYQPIQNDQIGEFADLVMAEFGAKYHSAGSLHGGARVFYLVEMPKQSFTLNGRDRNEAYVLLTNPHSVGENMRAVPTSTRVECWNTHRIAVNNGKGKGIGIRHTGNINAKVAEARQALGLAAKGLERYAEKAEVLSRTPLADVTCYANDVLDAVTDVTLADMQIGVDGLLDAMVFADQANRDLMAKSIERKIERRESILDDILNCYHAEDNGTGGMRGTAWAGFNSVTRSADHGKLGGRYVGSEHNRQSNRLDNTLVGRADDAKQVAFERAMALTT
jgi:phage/plasmid-like protein (TIGR03299 family)